MGFLSGRWEEGEGCCKRELVYKHGDNQARYNDVLVHAKADCWDLHANSDVPVQFSLVLARQSLASLSPPPPEIRNESLYNVEREMEIGRK